MRLGDSGQIYQVTLLAENEESEDSLEAESFDNQMLDINAKNKGCSIQKQRGDNDAGVKGKKMNVL